MQVGIIKQINSQFVKAGVKFVIQVGDLVDKEKDADEVGAPNLMTRAAAATDSTSTESVSIRCVAITKEAKQRLYSSTFRKPRAKGITYMAPTISAALRHLAESNPD